ncbi:hypothetical protein [Paenibacillus eucommiae]|uniref:Uncharacterized protein n=1 Tax=Paenibacillus eucommiae TaxID=1355755 RepID=A0ABS4IQN8_9BACL|nr:hypothetical protein [Paenibacillus eucommiae]MBP1989874.1 hypothetical protein [Paenibacillus eucommiae]
MQPIGRVHFQVDHKGLLTKLVLLQDHNGHTKNISLDKEKNYINLKMNGNATKIMTIEQIGDKIYTGYSTYPGKHKFTKKDLQLINDSLLKRLKHSGRQKIIILF